MGLPKFYNTSIHKGLSVWQPVLYCVAHRFIKLIFLFWRFLSLRLQNEFTPIICNCKGMLPVKELLITLFLLLDSWELSKCIAMFHSLLFIPDLQSISSNFITMPPWSPDLITLNGYKAKINTVNYNQFPGKHHFMNIFSWKAFNTLKRSQRHLLLYIGYLWKAKNFASI